MKTQRQSPDYVTDLQAYRFKFGQYKGYTAQYVLDNDPSYILWLDDNKIVRFPGAIIAKISTKTKLEYYKDEFSGFGLDDPD